MNDLKTVLLFLTQRRELLEARLELVRYRNEDSTFLGYRLNELGRIINVIKIIEE